MNFRILIIVVSFLCAIIHLPLQAAEVKNHWDGNMYSANAQAQAGWADRFFFSQYQFNGTEKVLDIGSGDGKITARIAEKASHVVGIDKSESMVAKAKQAFKDTKNLELYVQDASDERFYSEHQNQFDLITSFATLHWVKDQQSVLNGIYKSLNDSGKVYIKTASKGGDPIQDLADEISKTLEYKTHFKSFSDPMTRFNPQEYAAFMHNAGFKVLSIRDNEEKDKIVSKANLVKQVKSWLPHYHHLKNIEVGLAERYIEYIASAYLKKYPADKYGNIILYDHYLEVIGEKN